MCVHVCVCVHVRACVCACVCNINLDMYTHNKVLGLSSDIPYSSAVRTFAPLITLAPNNAILLCVYTHYLCVHALIILCVC